MPVTLQSLRTVLAHSPEGTATAHDSVGGRKTDAFRHADPQNRVGTKIANSKGVPGTFGCLAFTIHDGRTVLLTSAHVLFGNGALERDRIWLVDESKSVCHYVRVGTALYGKTGIVLLDGDEYYVDCAIGSVSAEALPAIVEHDVAKPDDQVTKMGAATGTTTGVVVDVAFRASALANGREKCAPRQLLIRSLDENAFSAEGDSGAVIVNDRNRPVGLLWGANCRGEGVACHMSAVVHCLNIMLAGCRA